MVPPGWYFETAEVCLHRASTAGQCPLGDLGRACSPVPAVRGTPWPAPAPAPEPAPAGVHLCSVRRLPLPCTPSALDTLSHSVSQPATSRLPCQCPQSASSILQPPTRRSPVSWPTHLHPLCLFPAFILLLRRVDPGLWSLSSCSHAPFTATA